MIPKNVIRYLFLFAMAVIIFFVSTVSAQQVKPIVQSPFYDAVSILYALKGYKVYPVTTPNMDMNGAFGNQGSTQSNPVPAARVVFKVIESTSGKVIRNGLNEAQMKVLLDSNKFSSENDKREFIFSILARNARTDDASEANVKELYKDNLYFTINDTSRSFKLLKDISDVKFSISESVFSPDGSGTSGSTMILEGLASFYVDALNREINDAFFVYLKDALSKYPELKLLFSKTVQSLDKIQVTNYAASMTVLRSSFEEDLKNLLVNISGLPELPRYSRMIDDFPELTVLFLSCDLISQLKKSDEPADILYNVSNEAYIQKPKPNNFNSTIKLAALISYCLRDIKLSDANTNKIGWIDAVSIQSLVNDRDMFTIFMGLMAQNANGIFFTASNTTIDFRKLLIEKRKEILEGQYIAYNFSETAKKITSGIKGLRNIESKTNAKKSDLASKYIDVTNQLISLADNCLDILPSEHTLDIIRKEVRLVKNTYLPLVKQAYVVQGKIEDKAYSAALIETDTLLTRIFLVFDLKALGKTKDSLENELKKLEKDILITDKHDKIQLIQEQLQKVEENKNLEEIKTYFIKYGTFISSIAMARTSDEVKEAINNFALKKGSSRIKKEHDFSVGLNGYVGVYHAWNTQYQNAKLPESENGITAPLGIAANWGHFLGGSLTAYTGVIDIGAIFTYKVNSDSSIKSDISFAQVLSPSVGLIYGLPLINKKYNIPLSIGANVQWGPTLRKVTDTGNSVLPSMTKRFNIFVMIDLPIVNFHVSRK